MALERVGLLKTTLVDFPGEVAAAVFTPGCNLRCGFCHNPELLSPPYPDGLLPLGEVKDYIASRRNLLGGVCITGGEPLLHEDLYDFISHIKNLGLKVKLDTNGTFPSRIDFKGVDYIAMDVKTTPEKYGMLTLVGGIGTAIGDGGDAARVAGSVIASVEKIIASGTAAGLDYEFRTTLVPGIVGTEDIRELCCLLKEAKLWILAPFNPKKTLNPALADVLPYTAEETQELADIIRAAGIPVKVRGG